MAWVELHDTLGSHRKTYALADALDIPQYAAVGLLCLLWTWALNSAQDGDLSKFPPHAIARACYWQKKPELLADALLKCGWMDADMRLHDWEIYAGRLIDKREDEKRRVAAYRTGKKRVPYTYSTRTVQDQTHDGARVPYTYSTRTVQDQTHDGARVQYASTVPNSTVPNNISINQSILPDGQTDGQDEIFGLSPEEAIRIQQDQDAIFSEAHRCGLPESDRDRDNAVTLYQQYGVDKLLDAIRKTGDQAPAKRHWRYVKGILADKKGTQEDGVW